MYNTPLLPAGSVNTEDNLNTILFTTEHRRPHFQSARERFEIKVGDDVTFPCLVNNKGRDCMAWTLVNDCFWPGKDVITWKNGVRLLTAGPIKVYNEERLIHRYNGSEITLRDVQPKDAGEYSCQLNSVDTPIELIHHLDVLSKFQPVAELTKIQIQTFPSPLGQHSQTRGWGLGRY